MRCCNWIFKRLYGRNRWFIDLTSVSWWKQREIGKTWFRLWKIWRLECVYSLFWLNKSRISKLSCVLWMKWNKYKLNYFTKYILRWNIIWILSLISLNLNLYLEYDDKWKNKIWERRKQLFLKCWWLWFQIL